MTYTDIAATIIAKEDWTLWFLKLSGWPVFLTIVGTGIALGILASVVLAKASNRSAVRVMVIATLVVAAIGVAGLTLLVWLMRS
jgi:hypothetical protein